MWFVRMYEMYSTAALQLHTGPMALLCAALNFIFPLQPNARKEDLFGRPSQGLYSSSYMATKGMAETSMDRNCLEVNKGSSLPSPTQVYHPSVLDQQCGSCSLVSTNNKHGVA